MKRRILSIALAVLLSVSLLAPLLRVRTAAAESVYFTAVNDSLCTLSDSTMPFWSGGNLYLPSSVFSSYDLGLSYMRDTSAQSAILYTNSQALEFSLTNGGSNNMMGTYYSASAITRSGTIYLPVAFVSNYFGLSYSVRETTWAPMVRVRSSAAVLSDAQFIDAASTLMASRYNAYQQAKNPTTQQEETTSESGSASKETESGDENTAVKTAGRVLLAIRAGEDAQALSDMLDTLDRYGYQATFFFSSDALAEKDDLLRRIVSSGHRLGLAAEDGSAETLREGNETLRCATGTVTRLALCSQAGDAAAAGYALYVPTLSAETMGTTASGRAQRVQRRVENASGTVKLLLSGDSVSAGALESLCRSWYSADYTVRAVTETACQ